MEEKATQEVKSEGEIKNLSLEFLIPENLPTVYANEMAIQTIHTEFVLSFFELRLPLVPPIDTKQKGKLNANCVARVVLSVEKIPDIIRVLQGRFDEFIRQREETEKSIEEKSIEE